jgi:transposase
MDEQLPAPDGISAEDWDATPARVRAFVVQLAARILALEARLNQSSQNSSKPPSSDPPSAPPRPPKVPRGRPRGGQPGHVGQTRDLLPPDQVDEIVPCRPTHCPNCQTTLAPDLPIVGDPWRTQSWELPVIRPHVTEYQQQTVCCPQCRQAVLGARPPDAPPGGFGPRATTAIGLLRGAYHQSERIAQAILTEICGLPISLGSVARGCGRVSQVLEPIDAAIQALVQAQPAVNVDETSWREPTKAWLWTATTPVATCFRISPGRGRGALTALLGESYAGIVGSDRWSAYRRIPVAHRQICWSHLDRNLQALADYGSPDSPWATRMLTQVDALWQAWHAYRDGLIDRAGLQTALLPIQQAMHAELLVGQTLRWHKISGFSTELLGLWDALWTFADHDGVEPTNNAAERVLRPAVIWRKLSGGTQSRDGSRFVERILSVVTTCRQQHRNVFAFLTEAVQAAWAGQPTPLLVTS